jgi:hypothetical protein
MMNSKAASMSATLAELHLLTDDSGCEDYRPVVGPTGEVVIFERTQKSDGKTVLYRIDDLRTPDPQPFLSNPGAPPSQTRPDWNWRSNRIAFNGAARRDAQVSVWITLGDEITAVPNTEGLFYPTWTADDRLVASNSSMKASPRPSNPIIDIGSGVKRSNIDGTDTAGTPLYGGMPAARPGLAELIAFAGQPEIENWGGTGTAAYDQNFNYIFLNAVNERGIFTSQPIESDASVTNYDPTYQGRAPAWSPDGRTIAFESNRSGNAYSIYLCDIESGAITPVTDPKLGAQHAKFFPCGTKLILGARPKGNWSIAWVDISSLLES